MRHAICLTLALLTGSVVTADPPPDQNQPELEMVERRVRVLDPDMTPVEGAVVKPIGFRTRQEPGSHHGWHEPRFGPQPVAITDKTGTARLKVPRHVYEQLEIGQVSWVVDHADYVTYYKDHSIDEDPAIVSLVLGYRIAATAVDEDEVPLHEHLYAIQSGSNWSSDQEWTLTDKGVIVSRVFGHQRSTLRIMHLPPAGRASYSELLNVERPEGDRVFLKQVKLRRATRVKGKLDPAVPRPVKNGRVTAFVCAAPANGNDEEEQRERLWSCNEFAEVAPDGSFVIESLPRGDAVQLIALCDGWVSRNPEPDDLKNAAPELQPPVVAAFTYPQVARLKGDEIQVVLKMEPTATCQVKVVTPNGQPLPGAEVSMWPNHAWLRGGSTILGFGFSTSALLRQSREGAEPPNWGDSFRYFSRTTNDLGIATIVNLHGKPNVGMAVVHGEYDQPIGANLFRATAVSLKPGEVKEVTVQMQPKGVDVIGR